VYSTYLAGPAENQGSKYLFVGSLGGRGRGIPPYSSSTNSINIKVKNIVLIKNRTNPQVIKGSIGILLLKWCDR